MEYLKMVSSLGGLSCESAPVSEKDDPIGAENQAGTQIQEPKKDDVKEPEPVHADETDRLFAWIYLLVGYGFIYTFSGPGFMRNLAVYTIAYTVVVLLYVRKKGIHPVRESYFWMGILLASAVPYAFWSIMPFFQVIAVIFLAAFWTLQVTGSFLETFRVSQWVAADSLNALVMVPFGNFACQLKILRGRYGAAAGGKKRTGTLGAVVLGLLISIPLLLIVLPLLSSADAGFQFLAADLFRYGGDHLLLIFVRALFSIPVAAYLYGLVYGGIHKRSTGWIRKEKIRESGEHIRIVPDTAVLTAVMAVCSSYILFMGLQARYLFSAFWGTMPSNFTYAEYARRGFFELCAIAFLNLLLLFGANLFARTQRKKNSVLRFANILLAVLTLLLILTAMSKMGMYIAAYGLTVKRILTMAFMFWMVIVFVLTVIWQRKEVPIIRICVMAGAVIFCLLCVVPINKCI